MGIIWGIKLPSYSNVFLGDLLGMNYYPSDERIIS